MDVIARRFFDFFEDFVNLYLTENWPDDSTSEAEIKNSFLIADHIEKCFNKLESQAIEEFLNGLADDHNLACVKQCFVNPTKCILRKLINSSINVEKVDVALKLFINIFDKKKLEDCLTDLMVETASKETLMCHVRSELSLKSILQLKSNIFLYKFNITDNKREALLGILKNCNKIDLEIIIHSILSKEIKYADTIAELREIVAKIMSDKSTLYQKFWKSLFIVDNELFLELCLECDNLFKIIVKALVDCGMLLKEKMSSESFYINLNYIEFSNAVRKICTNDVLRSDLQELLHNYCNVDKTFWQEIIELKI